MTEPIHIGDLLKRIERLERLLLPLPKQTENGYNCPTCGMFFEYGKAYGFVCVNPACPSKMSY